MKPPMDSMSPREVAQSPKYEVQSGYQSGSWFPSASEIVVKHLATGSYWKAVYVERADDNDYGCSATWKEVTRSEKVVVMFEYR